MIYRSGADRLAPHQVRAMTFRTCWRGLDPVEVYACLSQLADELDRLRRDLTTATTQAERITQGLRQWRYRHANCRLLDPEWPTVNRGRW